MTLCLQTPSNIIFPYHDSIESKLNLYLLYQIVRELYHLSNFGICMFMMFEIVKYILNLVKFEAKGHFH